MDEVESSKWGAPTLIPGEVTHQCGEEGVFTAHIQFLQLLFY